MVITVRGQTPVERGTRVTKQTISYRSSGGGRRTVYRNERDRNAAKPQVVDTSQEIDTAPQDQAVASTVGPAGEPGVIRQQTGGFSSEFQGGAGVGRSGTQTFYGTGPKLPEGTTGEVQPSAFEQPSKLSTAKRGFINVFTNPKEAGRVLRYPVTASSSSPPALREAAREDLIASLGAGAGVAAVVTAPTTAPIVGSAVRTALPFVTRNLAPVTTRYVAPSTAPLAVKAVAGAAEATLVAGGVSYATRFIEERTRPSFVGASRTQVTSAGDLGVSAGVETQKPLLGSVPVLRSAPFIGDLRGGQISTSFIDRRTAQQTTFNELLRLGLTPEEARRASTTTLSRKQTIVGGGEILTQLSIGRTSETVGGRFVATRFSTLAQRGVSVPSNIFSRGSQVIAPIAGAGFVEGTSSVATSEIARTGTVKPTTILLGGVLGGATAGLIGFPIAGAKTATARSAFEIPANVVDVFEYPGDVAARQGEIRGLSKGRSYDYPFIEDKGGRSYFGTARTERVSGSPRPLTRVLTGGGLSASSIPSNSISSLSVATPSAANVASSVPSPASSFVPVSSKIPSFTTTSSIVNTPSSIFTETPTKTSIPATTPVSSPVPSSTPVPVSVPVAVPKGGFPLIPPGGGLGSGGGGFGGGSRAKAGYVPSLAAVVYGIKGSGKQKGGFTGLELRPIKTINNKFSLNAFGA